MSEAYSVENALFEIWGALQVAENIWDVRNVAEKALKRCGVLEKIQNEEVLPHES